MESGILGGYIWGVNVVVAGRAMCFVMLLAVIVRIVLIAVVLLMGCGGSASQDARTMRDGTVIVRNETSFKIRATVGEVAGADPVETMVEGNETKEICDVLAGETEVEVVLVAELSAPQPLKIRVTIDGNVMIRVLKVAWAAPMEYEITGG